MIKIRTKSTGKIHLIDLSANGGFKRLGFEVTRCKIQIPEGSLKYRYEEVTEIRPDGTSPAITCKKCIATLTDDEDDGPIPYKKEIHMRALEMIQHKENVARYEADCLKAGICAKCGYRLVTQPSETRRDAMGLLDETICMNCGYLAQLN